MVAIEAQRAPEGRRPGGADRHRLGLLGALPPT
jgi:hypothetical protein